MRAGKLDRKVTLQRKAVTHSSSGQPIETWETLAGRRWASVGPLQGDEKFTDPAFVAKQQVVFTLRWSRSIADFTPLDRIIYPAINEGDTPPTTSIYDVLEVHELGRRVGWRVVGFRRTEP